MRYDIVEVKNAWEKSVYRVTVSAICSSADLLCRVKATILILSRIFPKIFPACQGIKTILTHKILPYLFLLTHYKPAYLYN